MDMPIQDKPSSSGAAQAAASSAAQAAASAAAQLVPSRETLERAYKSVKDTVGNVLSTVKGSKPPMSYITSKRNIESQYKDQIKKIGTPEAVMNEELRTASNMLTMLTPTPNIPITIQEAYHKNHHCVVSTIP